MAKKSVYLPEEVIKEILLRLPVKSVLRCKGVCKLWLSLISDPHFATSHFQHAVSSKQRLVFIDFHVPETLSIDFNASLNDDSAYHSLSLDFLPRTFEPKIRGSCRGFLLLDVYPYLYLWNPSTGGNKQIPMSPITIANNIHTLRFVRFMYGLVYEPSTDDYLVVLGYYKGDEWNTDSTNLEIFSLRANDWKQVEFGSRFTYRNANSFGFGLKVESFLNGSIHWLVYNYQTKRNVIIAFDTKEMTMSEIALPDDFSSDVSHRIYDLLVFGGLISVWKVEMSTIKIWVMQEYRIHLSWTKTIDFSFYPAPDFSPVCFTSCGDIVGPSDDGGLVKITDKGQLLEHRSHDDCCFVRSQMAVYTESLLSLPDGTEQA